MSLIHVDSKNMTDTIRCVKINYSVHNSPTKDPVESIPHLNTSFLAIHCNRNILSILRVPQYSLFRIPGWIIQVMNYNRSSYVSTYRHQCQLQRSWEVKKGKAIPLQDWPGPEGSSRVRLPDLKTIGIWRWKGCQPYAPAAFTPRKYSWYSFLLEDESTTGP
jgi:hypothetical protein